MSKFYFLLYYNDESNQMAEIVKADNKLFIRGEKNVTPIDKAELKAYTKIGEIYSNKASNLKGFCRLFKIEGDRESFCGDGYLQAPIQEGKACKINSLREWYRTNIIVGITKRGKDEIEFWTLSGSFYRIVRRSK